MNFKITTAVMAVLASGAAYANPCTGSNTVNCNAGNGNITSQTQGQGQNAYGGSQGQGQSSTNTNGQSQTALGGAGGASASRSQAASTATQGITESSVDSGNTYIPRAPVNTAIAGFQETTAACWHAEGLGIQAVSAGGSAGFTFRDHECMKYTLAMSFYAHGKAMAGDRMMCSMKEVQAALGNNCMTIVEEVFLTPALPAEPVAQPDYVTQDELNNVVKKLLRK